jgi:acylglycerol lipase
MWLAHGDQDRITSHPATKRLAQLLAEKGDVVFASYEGAYHKLQAELPETRAQFCRDVSNWILGKSGENQSKL